MLSHLENQPQPRLLTNNQPQNQNHHLQNHQNQRVDQEVILDQAQLIEKSELKSSHKEWDRNISRPKNKLFEKFSFPKN